MNIKNSVIAKLISATALGIFLVLLLTTLFVVNKVSETANDNLNKDIRNALELNSSNIENYFTEHITRASVLFRNPSLIDWFTERKVRGSSLEGRGFEVVKEVLTREVEDRKDISSVFFGSAFTGEYFQQDGISALAGYNVLTRPWWQEIRDTREWNVSGVTYEPQIEAFYLAMNIPIYDFNESFIGAGGVDLYLTSIAELVSKISYNGKGRAFLIDSNGDMIVFPDEKLADVNVEKRETTNIQLAQLDANDLNNGFSALFDNMTQNETGITQVTWRDDQYYVQFKDVAVDKLNLKWKLAIMVPQNYVDAPVRSAIWSAALASLLMLVITLVIVFFVTSRLLRPLLGVKHALVEIADGAGDLSQRIHVKSEDEVGQLSESFNKFIEQIQNIVKRVQLTSDELKQTTAQVSHVSEVTASKTGEAQLEIHSAADTVTQMAETAHVIKEQISIAQAATDTASKSSKRGQEVIASSMAGLDSLNSNFDSAVHTIEELKESSQSIGEVMDVIRTIADQTNLLALNAAIESARAGEHGRGFAVVADEVRQLAQRTQESTASIQSSIEDLQNKANAAESQMAETRSQVSKYMEESELVNEQLTEIGHVVEENKENMQSIANITNEQDDVAQQITHVMQQVNRLGDETSNEAQSLQYVSNELESKTNHLKELVERFKV